MICIEGYILPNKPLTNFELMKAVKALNIAHFRGVFLRDTLPNRSRSKECGILNLDNSRGRGTHWVCWYISKGYKHYFDSYGLQPPLELIEYLRSPIYYNTDEVQPRGSSVCGHLCVYVLKKLSEGSDFQNIINNLI